MHNDKKKAAARAAKLPAKPFFARFLEKQQLSDVVGGIDPPAQTQRYPSDDDQV
jgi:hypothetical protein